MRTLQVGEPRSNGFVAMEYFALILNRSFVIFLTNEGLRVWRFAGPVGVGAPLYFLPFDELLDDPMLTPGTSGFDEFIAGLKTSLIPYRDIENVEFRPGSKWGMGPIPHSGRLNLRLAGGRKREFILLGFVNGNHLQQLVASRIVSMARPIG